MYQSHLILQILSLKQAKVKLYELQILIFKYHKINKGLIAENNTEGSLRNYGYLGWLLINGVMSIDQHWIGSRLKTLMDLWKSVFGNEESF